MMISGRGSVMSFTPSYLKLHRNGILKERAEQIEEILEDCTLCPNECHVNRINGEYGICRSGILPVVSSFSPHFGEEPVLTGRGGSGTIFFTNCNLTCIFCQNYDISQLGSGLEVSYRELARMMLFLQGRGCHNINFVTPTHMVYAILKALPTAIERGLNVPLVYNSGGYDSVKTLRLLDGIFDIYMPDMKYADEKTAFELSGIHNYPDTAMMAIREMYLQAGDLETDNSNIAVRGLIIRHLVLPQNTAGTDRIINFVAGLSGNTYFNLMDQYRPCYHASDDSRTRKRLLRTEFLDHLKEAEKAGLIRCIG